MSSETQRIGFLGVGHLARCLIAGFLKSGLPADRYDAVPPWAVVGHLQLNTG